MLRNPALVLVDLQQDFCRVPPSSDVDSSTLEATLDATARFLEQYRESGRTPILVRTTHDERTNSPVWAEKYANRDRPMPCQPGTEGAEFTEEIRVTENDIVVTKHRYSAFHETDLETYLASNDITHLLVGGVNTNVCVASTVADAFDRDYRITLLEDCTATIEPALHDPTIDNIESNVGTVRQSSEIEL